MKKCLVPLMAIFFILIISSSVFAAIPEEISDEFKSMLNENGELIITDTANVQDDQQLLGRALSKYNTEEYFFHAYYINAEHTRCKIEKREKVNSNLIESCEVDVKFEEKYSEQFKKLTKDGYITITSSTLREKDELIYNYCETFMDGDYRFYANDISEDKTQCTISLCKTAGMKTQTLEHHLVKIKYEEKYSEEFKKVTKDGKIVIRASRSDGKQNLINQYCWGIATDPDRHFYASDINEDGAKCVIKMQRYIDVGNTIFSVVAEQHVVDIEYDTTMSKDFKKHLNKDGKFVVDSIKPKDKDEWLSLFDSKYYYSGIFADYDYLSEDLSSCEVMIKDSKGRPETHRVEFVYQYDEKIKKIASEMATKLSKDVFLVKDMELVNYWLNSEDESKKQGGSNFDNYSGELKSCINHKNFKLSIDHRAGADAEFLTLRAGIGLLEYKGTVYYIDYYMEVLGNHILYVPDDTPSTKEALLAAIQKRVDEYAGKGKVKITAGEGTVLEYHTKAYRDEITRIQALIDLEEAKANPDRMLLEKYKSEKERFENGYNYFLETYNNPEGENYFLQNAEGDYWFTATIDGVEHKFIVIKDSKSMVVPKHKTSDIKTNIEISSNSNSIPLDTIIEAIKMENGEEYERIMKILNVKDNETFDLNLFSKTLNEYITRLASGNFEVRIPIPENLKEKNLMVYYVGEDNKIEEYNIVIEDGYAIFTTNHFSTYTLAEKSEETNVNGNTNLNNGENNNAGNDTAKENTSSNPKTGDNIILFVVMFVISLLGIAVTTKLSKKNK